MQKPEPPAPIIPIAPRAGLWWEDSYIVMQRGWAEAKRRQALLWGGGAFLVAAALMALITSVVYEHDSKVSTTLRGTAVAVVGSVIGLDFGYRYGQCVGLGTRNPPPAIGAQVRIFYDPNDACRSVDYDPVARQRSDLIWLLVFSAVFTLAVGSAGWDATRQR